VTTYLADTMPGLLARGAEAAPAIAAPDRPALSHGGLRALAARTVTSVCTGALLLGAAGLLKGRRATTYWNARDFLPAFGAIPAPGRVVRDGNVVTAGGVTAGIDFALSLVAELADQETAETIQLCLEYAPAPPFAAGTPEKAPAAVLARARQRQEPSLREREAIIATH